MGLQQTVECFYRLKDYLKDSICLPIKEIKYENNLAIQDLKKFKFEVSKTGEQFIVSKNERLNSKVAMGCLNINQDKTIFGIMVEFRDDSQKVTKNIFYEPEESKQMTFNIMSNFFGFDVEEVFNKGKENKA